MEINEQLFEDILAGKLKGVFVLKNKQIVKSSTLKRSSIDNFLYALLIKYDNGITDYGTYKSNGNFETITISYFDIIDFIPDTDMKDELTIEIPEGKEVDWEESKKQNKIVLKDKQLTYKYICKKLFENKEFFFTDSTGVIESSCPVSKEYLINAANNSTSYHQLECILAKNKLATVAKYLNDGWKPSKGSNFCVIGKNCELENFEIQSWSNTRSVNTYGEIWFKSKELAQQAIEILGEETVKLALEPLGV